MLLNRKDSLMKKVPENIYYFTPYVQNVRKVRNLYYIEGTNGILIEFLCSIFSLLYGVLKKVPFFLLCTQISKKY